MKPLELLFGLFRYRRTPAAQIDGGMAEYVFQQFDDLPPQNVVAGRGYIYQRDLMLAEPDLFIFAPAQPPFDVTKIGLGVPDIEQAMIEEDLLA
jgi:hypothetical protein